MCVVIVISFMSVLLCLTQFKIFYSYGNVVFMQAEERKGHQKLDLEWPYIFLFLLLSREYCCMLKKINNILRLKEINLPQQRKKKNKQTLAIYFHISPHITSHDRRDKNLDFNYWFLHFCVFLFSSKNLWNFFFFFGGGAGFLSFLPILCLSWKQSTWLRFCFGGKLCFQQQIIMTSSMAGAAIVFWHNFCFL